MLSPKFAVFCLFCVLYCQLEAELTRSQQGTTGRADLSALDFLLEQQHIPTTFVQCIKTSWSLSLVACIVYSLCSSFAICMDFQCFCIVLKFKNWKVFTPFFCLPFFLLMSTFVTLNTFLGPVQASFSTALLGIYYLGTTRAYLTCCREGSCSIDFMFQDAQNAKLV